MGEVFISHSARGDVFAEGVLKAVVDGLTAKSHIARVDENDIPSGDEWRPVVVDWLARCDAAVVLLNRKALESTWVRREVNILMWRRALGAPLFVVPVLMDGLRSKDVKMAGLEELNPIQFARTPRGADPDADDLARQVLDRFAEMPAVLAGGDPGNPMSDWLRRLAAYLAKAARDPHLIDDAARELFSGDEYRSCTDRHGAHLFLAHQFLVAPADRVIQAVGKVAPALSDETLERLCAELAVTWVDAEAARGLLPGPGTTPQEMTILLNACQDRTAEQYIRRATCAAVTGYETAVYGVMPTGERTAAELKADLENAMWKDLFDIDAEEDRWLPPDIARRATHYLVINGRRPPNRTLAEAARLLHSEFSWLILLVTTGAAPLEEEAVRAFGNATVVSPPLSPDDENYARHRNTELARIRKKLTGRH
ncbi:toll/interleukin-1 receptor domain-containing protein [Streptomyces sp. IBSBF 2953]|uniref:toll/interleukin-1 receptor domain-containing protein n=1 Tax=Streptomyces sp. B21-097 TaxID=3039414 RepID=UPI00211A7125|nr:toll/interleukin-1 receptor domain-containing protein [Streptomyces hayashii]